MGGKAKNRAFKEPARQEEGRPLPDWSGTGKRTLVSRCRRSQPRTLKPDHRQERRQSLRAIMTDESPIYRQESARSSPTISTVNHSANEYVRLGAYIGMSTLAESFFSIVKRGIVGHLPQRQRGAPTSLPRRVRLSAITTVLDLALKMRKEQSVL